MALHLRPTECNAITRQGPHEQPQAVKSYVSCALRHMRCALLSRSREKGCLPSVLEELERALNDHELIKVKVSVGDREQRDADRLPVRPQWRLSCSAYRQYRDVIAPQSESRSQKIQPAPQSVTPA